MNKLESNMINAIRNRKDWQCDNTRVAFSPAQTLGIGAVYLHGSPVALVMSDGTMRAVRDTFNKYPTRTTASRLRALGFGAHILKGKPVLTRTEVRL